FPRRARAPRTGKRKSTWRLDCRKRPENILLCQTVGGLMRRTLILPIAALAFAALLAHAADEYPAGAVRIVGPFAPGGGTDVVGRILARELQLRLGTSFVIDTQTAGSGLVG